MMMQKLKKISVSLIKYRLIIVWIIILGLFGFTLLKARGISDPRADQNYLNQKRQETTKTTIKVDENVKARIEKLIKTPVDVTPDNLGTRDPFNP